MGAINYNTSDFITIGYNCNDIDYDEPFYYEFIQDDHEQTKYILDQYNFCYFDVKIKPGYYTGFYIDIEFNYKYCFDNYKDKRDALKEITQIKKFLLSCLDFGCCAVWPGWCTTYFTAAESIEKINASIKEMRATVQITPTWARLPASEKYA